MYLNNNPYKDTQFCLCSNNTVEGFCLATSRDHVAKSGTSPTKHRPANRQQENATRLK